MTDVNKKIAEWEKSGMRETGAETEAMWDFDKEPVFEGVFVEKREGIGQNNSNLYICEEKNSNQKFGIWGSSVLDTRLKNLIVGEEVGIAYVGKAKSEKTGRTYKNFRVFHGGGESPSSSGADKWPEEKEIDPGDIPF